MTLSRHKTPRRKAPRPESIKIEPNDKKNWSAVYIEFDEECVVLKGEAFGQPDVERMIILSNDQWEKLKKIKA